MALTDYTDDVKDSTGSILDRIAQYQELIIAVVVLALIINVLGVYELPTQEFFERFDALPIANSIKTALIGAGVGWLYFPRYKKKVLRENFEPDYAGFIVLDSIGNNAGVLKTNKDTLQFENVVFKKSNGDILKNPSKRRGDFLNPNVDWYLLRDIYTEKIEDIGECLVLEQAGDFPDADDDQIIANKGILRHYREQVIPNARFGKIARESYSSRLRDSVNKINRQLVRLHEHTTGADEFIDPERLFEEHIEGYERTELDLDKLEREGVEQDYVEMSAEEYIKQVEEEANTSEPEGDNL